MPSPFDVLGIDPSAEAGEIERAYRERLKEAHPDHGGSSAEFRAVRAAYAELTDGSRPVRPAPDSGPGGDQEPPHQPVAHVDYLNYDVVEDFGWSLDDEDLFDKAAAADLDPVDRGRFRVTRSETLLEAAEDCGFAWPYACRGGACANCAVAVLAGEVEMPVNHILPEEQLDRGIRLSCVGVPAADELEVVFNVKHLPDLDELRLPADRFELAQRGD